MNSTAESLPEPRIESGKTLILAGLQESYAHGRNDHIPAQWQRFAAYMGRIPGQIGHVAYGVCITGDNRSFDYLAAVEVAASASIEKPLTTVHLPARRYAVFTHHENIATLRRTFDMIWGVWAQQPGNETATAPFFERYGESFDPQTGNGGIELWIPLK